MLNTEVSNSPGYSYNNRRSIVCISKQELHTSFLQRYQASPPAKRVLVFGIQVSLFPRREPYSFLLHW